MKTATELEQAFGVYFTELKRCEDRECYWALLHLVLLMPDLCAALEAPTARVGDRYVWWCKENFRSNGQLGPGDLYQMRNALFHQGTTVPLSKAKAEVQRSSYASFSFVEPGAVEYDVHEQIGPDAARDGENLTLNISDLAGQMGTALRAWFQRIEADPARNAAVEENLHRLARVQEKMFAEFKPGHIISFSVGNTISST